jgi:hypothetical protein
MKLLEYLPLVRKSQKRLRYAMSSKTFPHRFSISESKVEDRASFSSNGNQTEAMGSNTGDWELISSTEVSKGSSRVSPSEASKFYDAVNQHASTVLHTSSAVFRTEVS